MSLVQLGNMWKFQSAMIKTEAVITPVMTKRKVTAVVAVMATSWQITGKAVVVCKINLHV